MAYPDDIDSFRTVENIDGVTYDESQTTRIFAEDVNNATVAIAAIENTLGTTPQGAASTVGLRISAVETNLGILENYFQPGSTYFGQADVDPDLEIQTINMMFDGSAEATLTTMSAGVGGQMVFISSFSDYNLTILPYNPDTDIGNILIHGGDSLLLRKDEVYTFVYNGDFWVCQARFEDVFSRLDSIDAGNVKQVFTTTAEDNNWDADTDTVSGLPSSTAEGLVTILSRPGELAIHFNVSGGDPDFPTTIQWVRDRDGVVYNASVSYGGEDFYSFLLANIFPGDKIRCQILANPDVVTFVQIYNYHIVYGLQQRDLFSTP